MDERTQEDHERLDSVIGAVNRLDGQVHDLLGGVDLGPLRAEIASLATETAANASVINRLQQDIKDFYGNLTEQMGWLRNHVSLHDHPPVTHIHPEQQPLQHDHPHEHGGVAPLSHEHPYMATVNALNDKAHEFDLRQDALETYLSTSMSALQSQVRDQEGHEHPPRLHTHPELARQIGDLAVGLTQFRTQVDTAVQALSGRIDKLTEAMREMTNLVEIHDHSVKEHAHEVPEHTHEVLESATRAGFSHVHSWSIRGRKESGDVIQVIYGCDVPGCSMKEVREIANAR